jgi:hypothetical protein
MYPPERHRKLRLLIKKVNRERKRQAKKIDILCNDLIAAQRDFIKRLSIISSTAGFYKSILGTTDLARLLDAASDYVKQEIPSANVAFFLRSAASGDGFELCISESDSSGRSPPASEKPADDEKHRFERCFTPELVENICKSNGVCTIEDMLVMGLQDSPTELNKISAATIPLEQFGRSLGFILLYRAAGDGLESGASRTPSHAKLVSEKRQAGAGQAGSGDFTAGTGFSHHELTGVSTITAGLSKAIQSCQVIMGWGR